MKTETAWAAGFFDGEGCTTLSVRKSPRRDYGYMVVVINQSGSPETLERFREAVGIGKVCGPYHPKSKRFVKPHWQYRAFNHDAWDVIRKLAPLLSRPKQEQALRCLGSARLFSSRPKFSKGPARKRYCKRGHDLNQHRFFRKDGHSAGCRLCLAANKQERAAAA